MTRFRGEHHPHLSVTHCQQQLLFMVNFQKLLNTLRSKPEWEEWEELSWTSRTSARNVITLNSLPVKKMIRVRCSFRSSSCFVWLSPDYFSSVSLLLSFKHGLTPLTYKKSPIKILKNQNRSTPVTCTGSRNNEKIQSLKWTVTAHRVSSSELQ